MIFPIQISLILFVTTFLSGMIVFFNNGEKKLWLNLLLAFSGAYLFAICALHLLPEIYKTNAKVTGVFLLVGFFVQIILELLSEGIEHGHIHKHSHTEKLFPVAMMIGLSIHAFLEGMPIIDFATSSTSSPLLIGIVIHNIPISIALMTVLLSANISKTKAIFWLGVFALMSPLGTIFSYVLNVNFVDSLGLYYNAIMAVVIGIFLHISTTILFESSDNHKFNMMKFAVIVAGACIAYITI
jgi:zinc transporter ZupT